MVDEAATTELRAAYRRERISRGKPFDAFCKEWVTPEPPGDVPYFGSWDNPKEIYAIFGDIRNKMDSDKIVGMYMPNPKDVKIGELEAKVAQLQAQLLAATR